MTGKWSPLVLVALTASPMRFSEVTRKIDGVSERMASQTLKTLKTLERDGFVLRQVLDTSPPKVGYSDHQRHPLTALRP